MGFQSRPGAELSDHVPPSLDQTNSSLSLVGLGMGYDGFRSAGGPQPTDLHLPPLTVGPAQSGTTQNESIVVDGKTRDYSVQTPKDWDGKKPLPVMYFLNGVSPGDPKDTFTGLSQLADKDGFMLVDLKGSGPLHTFNNGQGVFKGDNLNESNFLNAVHQKLQNQYPVDETRQGLTGFSEGGSEVFDLASKNNWVSSVQSVEGYMTGKEAPLNRPISAQIINAQHDQVVPIGGTRSLDGPAALTAGLSLLNPLVPLVPAAIDAAKGASATPANGGFWGQLASKVEGAVAGTVTGFVDRTVAPMLENFGLVNGANNYIEPQQYAVDLFNRADRTGAATVTKQNGNTIQDSVSTTTGAEVKSVQLGTGTHGWAGSTDHSGDIPGIGEPNETYNAGDQISQFFLGHRLGH